MKLHIFNPEHDLALAANQRNFTAPHAGRHLRSDLAFIPALWADEGDLVLVDDIDDAYDKVRHLGASYINKVEFITKPQLQKLMAESPVVDSVHPWGWNIALKGELQRIGTPDIMLPTDEVLAQVRNISSREWAAIHLQKGVVYAADLRRLYDEVRLRGRAVAKAPWSSSGRGVKYVDANQLGDVTHLSPFDRWAENIISQQGGIMVEPYYNKVKDFGMEFEMVDGQVEYRGLSLFQTVKNAYMGNLLATEEEKMEIMAPYVSADELLSIQKHVVTVMGKALRGKYHGPFGVDMMVCAKTPDSKDTFVNPCIELNLRRTMGHVALALSKREDLLGHLMRVDFDGNKYHLRVMPGKECE